MNLKKSIFLLSVALVSLTLIISSCASTPQHLADSKANYTTEPSESSKRKKISRNYSKKRDKHTDPPRKDYKIKNKSYSPPY